MKYRDAALFSDLDGTLFNCRGEVSAANRNAIESFIAKGGMFGIATGRASQNALQHLPGVNINAPSIVFNGAAVYDYANKRYILENHLGAESVPLIKELAECGRRLDIQIYTEYEIFYVTPEERSYEPFVDMHRPCTFCKVEDIEDRPWLKTLFLGAEEDLGYAGELIAQRDLEDKFDIVRGTTDILPDAKYIELLPHGTNKGSCVEVLRTLPSVSGRVIICVGDYWNDLEMLQRADVACVPRNGAEEIKAVARYITPDNNHDAIAYIIENIIPGL